MKKALIFGILSLSLSIPTLANHYIDHQFSCKITGDQRGLNSPLIPFPTPLDFKFSGVEIEGSRQLLNIKVSDLLHTSKTWVCISIHY